MSDYIDMDFIRNRISSLRVSANLSERKLSLDLGYNPSYIKEISSGRSKPSVEALLNICDYFKITPYEFFNTDLKNPIYMHELFYELNKKLSNNDIENLLKILRVLKPHHLRAFIDFLNQYLNQYKWTPITVIIFQTKNKCNFLDNNTVLF